METQHLVFYHNHKHIRKSNPRNSVRGLQGLYLSVIWWTRPNLFQQSLRASDSRFDMFAILSAWLRVLVPPQRPSGYESDELTVCSNPHCCFLDFVSVPFHHPPADKSFPFCCPSRKRLQKYEHFRNRPNFFRIFAKIIYNMLIFNHDFYRLEADFGIKTALVPTFSDGISRKKRRRITTTAHYMKFIVVYITQVSSIYCVTTVKFYTFTSGLCLTISTRSSSC